MMAALIASDFELKIPSLTISSRSSASRPLNFSVRVVFRILQFPKL